MFQINLVKDNKVRIVEYFGIELEVPIDTKYIAMDKNGTIVAYDYTEPYIDQDEEELWNTGGDYTVLSIVVQDYSGDWKDSLVKYD